MYSAFRLSSTDWEYAEASMLRPWDSEAWPANRSYIPNGPDDHCCGNTWFFAPL